MKRTDEFFQIIKDYWSVILSVVALVVTLGTLAFRVSAVEVAVKAKADEQMVNQQYKNLEDKIGTVQKGVDQLIDLHISN